MAWAFIQQPDYYWRDYDGEIPYDAVPGGYDFCNRTTYIGQVVFPGNAGLLPATIYRGQTDAVTCAYGHKYVDSNAVKILCSPEVKNFVWMPVNESRGLFHLTNYHIIKGGTEIGSVLYIGRAPMDNELLVGKVFPFGHEFSGLRLFTSKGNEVGLNAFDLLVYPNEGAK